MRVLPTTRLSLRPLQQGDAAALFAILGDPAAMEFWDRDPLPRLATAEALLADELAAMAAGSFLAWMAMKGGDAIGSLDLSRFEGGGAWLGFLLRRDQWGHGLAREALEAVIKHAFAELALERLWARVQTGNQRAIRLLRGLGFAESERLPGHVRRGGKAYDCAVFLLERAQSSSAKGV